MKKCPSCGYHAVRWNELYYRWDVMIVAGTLEINAEAVE